MVEALKGVNVDVAKIKVKENKQMSIRNSLQSYAFQDPAVKYLAQRVRTRSLFLHSYLLCSLLI